MSIFAIGDVHGDLRLLSALLEALVSRTRPGDCFIFLGDIIDGGPDSKCCVDRILELARNHEVVAIRGNHEEWLEATRTDHRHHSWILSMEGLSTVDSYSPEAGQLLRRVMRETGPDLVTESLPLPYERFFDAVPASHLDFFASMKDYHEASGCAFVHAGVAVDGRPLGRLETRGLHWGFDGFPERYQGRQAVVYGHWSQKAVVVEGKVHPFISNNSICLDTHKLGALTAFMLPEQRLIQVRA